jgi:hypothetical protein
MDRVRNCQGELLEVRFHQLHLRDPHQNIEGLLHHLVQLQLLLLLLRVLLVVLDM